MSEDFNNYHDGDVCHGRSIINILCQNTENIVFFSDDENIVYFHNELAEGINIRDITDIYRDLIAKIPIDAPVEYIKIVKKSIGASLFNALNSENKKDIKKSFKRAKRLVKNLHNSYQAKLYFISSEIIYTSIIGILFYFQLYPWRFSYNFILCGVLGSVGTLFSLLQRNQDINICLFSPKRMIFLESFIRSISGFLGGLIIFIVIKSNLILGLVKGNEYAMYTLSLISGFSERFIPEIFGKIKEGK